jgi:transcriptional regulator with XRE-family HTH domain
MPRPMLRGLGLVCQSARETHELSRAQIAAKAGVSEGTIRSFEQGEAWPREVEAIVEAYASAHDVPAWKLWEEGAGMMPELLRQALA